MLVASVSDAIAIRIVSVCIALVCAVFFSPWLLLIAVIVLGQGHFLIAYLYQGEAGKLGARKVLLLIAALFFFAFFFSRISYPLATFLAALAFLIHFVLDETQLLSGKHSLYTTLEALPAVLLYSGLLAESSLNVHIFSVMFGISLAVIAVYVFLTRRIARPLDLSSYGLFGWAVAALFAYFLHALYPAIYPLTWFLALVLVHILIWYGFFWVKLRSAPAARLTYVIRSLLINALLVVMAFIWIAAPFSFFNILFAPLSYYVWAVLHILSSLRSGELRASVRFS